MCCLYYYIKAICISLLIIQAKKKKGIKPYVEFATSLMDSPCFHFSFFPKKLTFTKQADFFFKGCKPSACVPCCSQSSLSAARRVQRGEWSTVNQDCYSIDYTARPSICLPLSPPLPPASQDAQIILPLDICPYRSLGPPTSAFSLWPANPLTHAVSLSPSQRNARECYLSPLLAKSTHRESEKQEIKIYWRLEVLMGVYGIEEFSRPLYLLFCSTALVVHKDFFYSRHWPALIDLSPVAAVVLLLGGKGVVVCRQDDMVPCQAALVIGSFLFRQCIEGRVARRVSRAGLAAEGTRFGPESKLHIFLPVGCCCFR